MTPPSGRAPRGIRVLSVRVRILTAILVVTALGLAISGGVSFSLQRERILASIDDELRQQVESVRTIVEAPVVPEDPAPAPTAPIPAPSTDGAGFTGIDEVMTTVLSRVLPGLDGSAVGLVDGVPRYKPGVTQSFDIEDDALLGRIVAETADGSSVLGSADTAEGTLRYAAVPLRVQGDTAVGVYVTAVRVEARLSDLASVAGSYAAVAAAALAVIGLVGWIVAGRSLRPIRDLRHTASRITATDLGERIPVTGNDDVSELTRTVNGMIARLEDSFEAQRRLLADVRHELSTPITIVRGHLELLDPRDPADVEATRAIAMDELDRMGGLIADIAELSQAEREDLLRPEPTDIGDLTRQVLAKASVMGGHEWRTGSIAEVTTRVDPRRITQAWLQLADNAAKYSPTGSVITVASEVNAGRLLLSVTDTGPGIPASARERIFERFGRVDDGRGIRGSGLGLAIVSAIMHAHGGEVQLDSVPGRGTRFALVLPLDSASASVTPEEDGLDAIMDASDLGDGAAPRGDRSTANADAPATRHGGDR